jgi:hypothetical protein
MAEWRYGSTSVLDGSNLASRPGRFTPREGANSTHWIGGWVGPRAGLDAVEKRNLLPLPGIEPRFCPARSPFLYRLRCWIHSWTIANNNYDLSYNIWGFRQLTVMLCIPGDSMPQYELGFAVMGSSCTRRQSVIRVHLGWIVHQLDLTLIPWSESSMFFRTRLHGVTSQKTTVFALSCEYNRSP